jgi:hypothetical protein
MIASGMSIIQKKLSMLKCTETKYISRAAHLANLCPGLSTHAEHVSPSLLMAAEKKS